MSIKVIIIKNTLLIGIEMEAYGVFYSAANSMSPKPIAISIKSVCDFADEHKSDNYQEYSAYWN